MRQVLTLHPDSRCNAAMQIEVDVVRPCVDNLVLSYVVAGNVSDLRLPPMIAAGGELWRHTCFEAFIGTLPGAAYYEFNFAPSRQWTAHQFSSYRTGMCAVKEMVVSRIEVQSAVERYMLHVSLKLDGLSGLPRNAGWRLGLAAVTEDMSGRQSYWALAHPPGKADFHHFDCFTHQLFPL